MRKFVAPLFALLLLAAACGESSADPGATDAFVTTDAPTTTVGGGDQEGEGHVEASHEEGEEGHDTEEAHDGGGTHHEGEDAHHDDGTHEEAHDDGEVEGDASPAAESVGDDNIPAPTGEVTTEYTVTLSDFAFDVDVLDLTPGETVRFTLVNDGVILHEFRLTTDHRAEEHLASGHEDHGDEGHHEDADIIVNVAAGETRVIEMTLPADATAIDQVACLLPGHYEAGMFAPVDF